ARTTRITVAVRVLNVCLRHVFLLASQLAVVQAVSGGRLDVGLGAGSFGLARDDHTALTIPFPAVGDRMARLDAACRLLPALLLRLRSARIDCNRGSALGPGPLGGRKIAPSGLRIVGCRGRNPGS